MIDKFPFEERLASYLIKKYLKFGPLVTDQHCTESRFEFFFLIFNYYVNHLFNQEGH